MNINTAIAPWTLGILAVGQLLASETPAPITPIQAPFEMPQLQRPVFPNKNCKLTDYGANADGTTNNTEAFRKAITACNAAGDDVINRLLAEGFSVLVMDMPFCGWNADDTIKLPEGRVTITSRDVIDNVILPGLVGANDASHVPADKKDKPD